MKFTEKYIRREKTDSEAKDIKGMSWKIK